MTGQIPPYGRQGFRREDIGYHPERANRIYALKRDPRWFIWADKTSEKWQVCFTAVNPAMSRRSQVEMATTKGLPVLDTLQAAMTRLLAGIEGGFYQVADAGPEPEMTVPATAGNLVALIARRARGRAAECALDASAAITEGKHDEGRSLLREAITELDYADQKERETA